MNISAGTVVPPALVLAVAGWSCWGIVGATAAKPKPKPAEGVAKLLEFEPVPPARHDPFENPAELEPPRPKEARAEAKPIEGPWSVARRRMAELSARLAAARAAEAKRRATLATLSRLPLSATSVHAERRTAMLAGRVYVEGETIEGTDPALGPVVLAEVHPRDVLLRSTVGTVAVAFADGSDRAASARRPARPATGAEKARKPRSSGLTRRGKPR
jgi:hypothetical protein